MKVHYQIFELRFRYPFTISKGTKTHQPTFVVELEFNGITGHGEAPAISYYHIPVAKMADDLERKKSLVEKFAFTDPERYWHYLHHLFPDNNFLVCALDMAAWDLYAQLRGKKLYELWKLDVSHNPLTDYTIGIDTVENMVKKLRELPWPIYKIKLGTREDIRIVEELRKHTGAVFRVDANCAWQVEETIKNARALQALGVEFIEQPLPKEDWVGMKALYRESVLPIIADESCVEEADVEKCHQHFHGINIKLTKCGGITPARRMIETARRLGLKVMIGSMNESTVGTSAVAHLLPYLDYADMDGPLLLAEDIATGVRMETGRICYADRPGIGVQLFRPLQSTPVKG